MVDFSNPAHRRVIQDRIDAARENAASELQALQIEITRRTCATLRGFISIFWDVLEPEMPLEWNWHLDELCSVLEKVERGEIQRVVINVPPGTMKSLLVSVFFRAYIWSKDPSKRFMAGSYGNHLSIRDNVKLRQLVNSKQYALLFPHVSLTGDQNAKEKFETRSGGWSIATSTNGPATGEHPDYTIIDDPLTEQQSRSQVERESANKWIDRTLSTRGVTRNMRTIVIMQRLHEDDPAGHLKQKGGWHFVVFPMRFMVQSERHTPDPRDHRTQDGELLWEKLFPEEKVRQLEIALGPFAAAGQLQQQPVPEGGGLFQREWFEVVDRVPNYTSLRAARGWDTAATEGDGDYTVGCKILTDGSTYYVVDVVRGQWAPGNVDIRMRQTAVSDGQFCAQREERETGASGKSVIAAHVKLLAGYDYAGVPITGDKIVRARPYRAQCEAGNVKLLRGAWNDAYLNELSFFPLGRNDDQVDASSCAFNALLQLSTNVLEALRDEAKAAGYLPAETQAASDAPLPLCENGCGRVQAPNMQFCCVGCMYAQLGGFTVHDSGILGHTEMCSRAATAEAA